jgi:hypothetical protein
MAMLPRDLRRLQYGGRYAAGSIAAHSTRLICCRPADVTPRSR